MEETTEFLEVVVESTFKIIDHFNTIEVFGLGAFDLMIVLLFASVAVSLLTRLLFGGGSNDDKH